MLADASRSNKLRVFIILAALLAVAAFAACGNGDSGGTPASGEAVREGVAPPPTSFTLQDTGGDEDVRTQADLECQETFERIAVTSSPVLMDWFDEYCIIDEEGHGRPVAREGVVFQPPPSSAPQGTPLPVPAKFVSVSVGHSHSCGLRDDGFVACWGNDTEGSATPPEGAFASVSAGVFHTCGVRNDSTVACLGQGHRGLGHATRGSIRLRKRGGLPHLRGEERRHRRLLGQGHRGLGHATRGSIRLRKRGGLPQLRSEGRRVRRLLGR